MTERRLDVDESRRAFALGLMKVFSGRPSFEPSYLHATLNGGPVGPVVNAENVRRARLARWQVPRV